MVIDKELIINAFFLDESFEQTWSEIKQEYEQLGFRDEISDEEMIAEFKYIAQQLRKYKFNHQDQVVNHDSVEDMIEEIKSLIGKAPEYGNSRKEIVYNFMRDHWLLMVHNVLLNAVTMNNGEEDEDA